jgi:hypothetical protein
MCNHPACHDPVLKGLVTCANQNIKPIVIIESPYAGNIEENTKYARECLRDSILRGEVPLASHLLYTQPGVLRDEVPEERKLGIDLGLEMRRVAQLTAVYGDFGISNGMHYGILDARKSNRKIEYRYIK